MRAGRVKMPRGLYNEALDVDAVRPFVLLPQSVYDNRLRDFNASFEGPSAAEHARTVGNLHDHGMASVHHHLTATEHGAEYRRAE